MAISRREILKRGVSYGTGVINFDNDCIAYERELRKLANNSLLDDFLTALTNVEQNLTEQPNSPEETAAANSADVLQQSDAEDSGSEQFDSEASLELSLEDIVRKDIEHELKDDSDSQENPLTPAIEAAIQFRKLCSTLALSDLYMKMNNVIACLQQACLPAVEDLTDIQTSYAAILDYLRHC